MPHHPSDPMDNKDLGRCPLDAGRSGGPSDPSPQAVSAAVAAPAANAVSFSPAPWLLEDNDIVTESGSLIAGAYSGGHTRNGGADRKRAAANARLIAAAPDLAETAQDALEFAVMFLAFTGRDEGTDRMERTLADLSEMASRLDDKARAALAKARAQ